MATYKITAFDHTTAQIVVEMDGQQPQSIDLPVDANGDLPTGDALNNFIIGFFPTQQADRLAKIQAGLNNATAIQALVAPPPPIDLTVVKEARKDFIDNCRDTQEAGGFTYLNKVFDSDPISAQRIGLAAQAAQTAINSNQAFSLSWTTQDNTVLTLTADQLVQMPLVMAIWANTLHIKATTLKQQIDACTSVAQITSIVW